MGIDRGVPRCPSQVLALSVWDVFSISLDITLGQSEIENEYFVGSLVQSDTEIVRLDVSVDEVPVVDVLDPLDHLVDQHQYGLQ